MLWIALYLPQLPLQLVQRTAFAEGFGGTSTAFAEGFGGTSTAFAEGFGGTSTAFAEGFGGTSTAFAEGSGLASTATSQQSCGLASTATSQQSCGLASTAALQRPCVIADGPVLRPLVLCANDTARERGVKVEMPVAAARALAGELAVLPRNPLAEAQALHNLACWASQFTPGVVIKPSEGLLLDVSTVLTLHGGLSRLLIRIGQGIRELGYHAEPGVAPTPLAAWLLAKARHAKLPVRMCRDAALLPERLAPLPMGLLDWDGDELNKLNALGIRRIGDCLGLPRDGFIRRFGAQRRRELDRMLGSEPDPRQWFTPPDQFHSQLDFGFEVNDALMLLFPLRRLLQELEGFLRGRGAGVQHWQLKFAHMSHRSSTLDLRVVAPERSMERFLALAREKLASATLEAPVLGIGLVATELLEFEENNRTLIPDPRSRALGWGQLVDKLAMRLGGSRVYRLRAVDDHRPEQAWKQHAAAPVQEAAGKASAKRAAVKKPPPVKEPPAKEVPVEEPPAKQPPKGPPANPPVKEPPAQDPPNQEPPVREPPGESPPVREPGRKAPVKEPPAHAAAAAQPPRPLWLLRTPRALLSDNGEPLCQGRLRLLAGPERLESGWWDGQSARRDYYVARNGKGETFWIYREHRRSKDWYLHGIFG